MRRKNENAARVSGVHFRCRAELPHAIAFMRALSRETRRDPAFFAITRAPAPRWISGCAAFSASIAFFLSPPLIASSTFLIDDRTRLRRAAFAAVRRSVWRARFSADL